MAGQDLAGVVTPSEVTRHGSGDGPKIAVIDTGIKGSMVRELVARGACVTLHPCTTTAADLLAEDPDAVFLANGPGDPAALDYVVDTVRQLVGHRPVWGICLGHQLLCRALGLQTFKLPFGHRGANHPVKEPTDGARGDHLPEPRLRGARAERIAHDRRLAASALAHGLRRGPTLAREPVRPHRRGL